MKVTALYIHPVKSLHRIELQSSRVTQRGLEHDRRWMLIDGDGRFLTQREHSVLATVRPSLTAGELVLTKEGFGSISSSILPSGPRVRAQVWNFECEAVHVSPEVDTWVSEAIGMPARLVYMPDDLRREIPEPFSEGADVVSFADAFQVLCATESSLSDLNSRLEMPVPMTRFRPNVVVDGEAPWDEDHWTVVQIGPVRFRGVHDAGRCLVTTLDQETGKSTGQEPLRTLATFRRRGNNVFFGRFLMPDSQGQISVGDEVVVQAKSE